MDIFAESRFDTTPRLFAPEGSLKGVVTPRALIAELEGIDWDSPNDADLVASIYLHGIKLFATAVYTGVTGKPLLELMRAFGECDLTDRNLPLHSGSITQGRPTNRKVWSRAVEQRFLDAQWKFLAPVFLKAHYSLDPACILPIMDKEEAQKGAFSTVYKATIHESHCIPISGSSAKPQVVALKQAQSERHLAEHNLATERESLTQFREFKHPHIILLVSSFTRGSDDFIIFEWADGGDLVDLWRKHEPSLNSQLIIDTLAQFRGLADALALTHKANIRHGDLKPDNILRSEDGSAIGCLKLGDWGLAKKHAHRTQERKHRTTTEFGTMLYEAPEAQSGGRARSRRYDIWSFGCVLLEHVVWLLYGDGERYRFIQDLQDDKSHWSFYRLPHRPGDAPEVHVQVYKWMEHIANDGRCRNTCISDLLDVIITKMLVVEVKAPIGLERPHTTFEVDEPPKFAPQPEPKILIRAPVMQTMASEPGYTSLYSRASAEEIVEALGSILDRAIQDPGYCIQNSSQKVFRGPEKRTLATRTYEKSGILTPPKFRTEPGSEHEALEAPEEAAASIQEATASPQEANVNPHEVVVPPQPDNAVQQPLGSAPAHPSIPVPEGTARIRSIFLTERRSRVESSNETPSWVTGRRGFRSIPPPSGSRSTFSSMSSSRQ